MRLVNSISRERWIEWQVYMEFEPTAEFRESVRDARLIKTLLDLTRDPKKHPRSPYKLEDLVLRFGDSLPQGPTRKQTWQQQKALLFGYAQEQAAAQTARRTQRTERKERVQARRPRRG